MALKATLLGNPKLLIMDEPSEGLAPTVVEMMIETLRMLEEEGIAILLIEQNLGVATAVAERQLIMVGGGFARETTASRLSEDSSCSDGISGSNRSRARLSSRTRCTGSASSQPASACPSFSVVEAAGILGPISSS